MVGSSVRVLQLAYRWLTRQEAIVLLVAFGIILALFVFAKTAGEMLEGDVRDFDEGLLRYLRDPNDPSTPIGPPWLLAVATDVSALGGTTVLAIVLVLVVGYLTLEHRYAEVLLVVVAASVGGALSQIMKLWFARARPDIVPHLVTVGSLSFPSGHSLLAVVTYLTLGALMARFAKRRRVRMYCIGVSLSLAFVIGVTRVYLGVHYPTDVLAGWSAGLAWALIWWLVTRTLQYRGQVKPAA